MHITETVLRDAQQSLIATRMPFEDFEGILDEMDQAGYHSIECWGGATFDSCLRYLHEDPWERLRKIKSHMKNTKLQMLLRGQNLLGYHHYSDDTVRRFVRKSIENGMDIIRIFDALNDLRNIETAVDECLKAGGHAQGCICYTLSPIHNLEMFVSLGRQIEAMGCNSLCIKDMAGIMSPQECYDLVTALKQNIKIPVYVHTHATTGLGYMTYLKAAEAGADGPTSILVASRLAADYLPAIAIAAYSYMALIPLIQPPIMRLLTTKKEREVKMAQLRQVSKTEKIVFPIAVAIIVILLIPDTAPLIGMLMLGNLLRECGVTDRLSDTAQNALCNIVTIFLGLSVGCKAIASTFLTWETIKIIILGLIAFTVSTVGGLLVGKVMYKLTGGKVNPLIGSAGVSAVPMAARVSQVEGQKANPANFLLMHAMGPNVAGVIGSAVAAGFVLKVFGA